MSLHTGRVRLVMKVFHCTNYHRTLPDNQNGQEKVWLGCLRIQVLERHLHICGWLFFDRTDHLRIDQTHKR